MAANHGAYSNLGTQVGGPVEVFRHCFADVLNQSFIVLSVAQASVLSRVCRQSYSKKTANIALCHQRFLREMTLEEGAQKFYTDDFHYPDMGIASACLKICFRGELSIRKSQVRLCVVNFILFSRNTLSNTGQHS